MDYPDPTRTEEFVELSSRHQRQLLGYIFTLVRDMNDAEDLVQQTNLVLWRRFDDYQPGTDFIRWACYVAHLQVLNFRRRKQHDPLSLSDQMLSQLADQRLDRAGLYEHFREALQQCMERLSTLDRELLDVCYDGVDSVRDVAAKLGRSADSVYHSLRRIRGVLFECINRTAAQEEQTP